MRDRHLIQLENKVYGAVMDDGIVDVPSGLLVLGPAFTIAADPGYLPLVVVVLADPIWQGLRRSWIEPRIGRVRLNSCRPARAKRGTQVAAVLCALPTVAWDAIYELRRPQIPGQVMARVVMGRSVAVVALLLVTRLDFFAA